eukprot:Amastigsp_a174936_128.p2 type:complete len:204 gc:universal Amastigsp_a174936_128:929-318(-)
MHFLVGFRRCSLDVGGWPALRAARHARKKIVRTPETRIVDPELAVVAVSVHESGDERRGVAAEGAGLDKGKGARDSPQRSKHSNSHRDNVFASKRADLSPRICNIPEIAKERFDAVRVAKVEDGDIRILCLVGAHREQGVQRHGHSKACLDRGIEWNASVRYPVGCWVAGANCIAASVHETLPKQRPSRKNPSLEHSSGRDCA